MGDIKVTYQYPYNPDYEYHTRMVRINLDEEKRRDVTSGNGFLISSPKTIKKDIKDPEGIFSSKYGQKIGEVNAHGDRYRCNCGALRQRVNHNILCPSCNTKVKYVDDNFMYFGYITIKHNYYIIHPNLYRSIEFLCGTGDKVDKGNNKEKKTALKNILNYGATISQDGHIMEDEEKPKNQPFYGIGMMEFKERFDEIMEYYVKKNPKKQSYYDDIMANKNKVFIQSIPVFTTHLRPADINGTSMFYEPINGIYNIMNKLVHEINKNKTRMNREKKNKERLLFDVQEKYFELYTEIMAILEGKKGQLRNLISGRFNFSARAVIVQDPNLRIDQVTLPYTELVIILQQKIINILHRNYNISFSDAHDIWEKSINEKDSRVYDIINAIIHSKPEGLPILLNRNPTIAYGSILQLFCIGMTDSLTIGVSLQILKFLAADFDGDTLNVFHIINQAFFERAYIVFNPRNSMYISRNNGTFNTDACVQRDTLINANTLVRLGRNNYSKSQMDNINRLKEKQQLYWKTSYIPKEIPNII